MRRTMIPFDYHVHTRFSGDNPSEMEPMCRAAVDKGIPELCFTEHFDLNPNEPRSGTFPLEEWLADLERCRVLFRGRLVIRTGLELGEPHARPDLVAALVSRHPFDLLIGSVHWVNDELVFEDSFFDRPIEEAFGSYFREAERMARAGGFQVLGHLDVVARTGYEVYGRYDPLSFEDEIRGILGACIRGGIVPEINSGAVSRRLGRLMPGIETLRWYVEMGGDRVVLGSDAHRPEQLGLNLEDALEAAKAVGIKYLVRFEGQRASHFTI
jgi:histidinol-phosphatase (PHP family)